MAKRNPSAAEIELVFETWRAGRPRPKLALFTKDRQDLIRKRLQLGYEAVHFVTLIEYVYQGDDRWCRWMRGEVAGSRGYTGLDNIFRLGKLGDNVEAALLWRDRQTNPEPEQSAVGSGNMGPLGAWRSRNRE